MINVSKIKKGIVLDHIEQGNGYRVFKDLRLDELDAVVVLLQNINSTSLGRKDLIKIETDYRVDFTALGLIAPHTTVNIIENGERIKKVRLELPEKVMGIMQCGNPRCVSNQEKVENIEFTLHNAETKEYRCEYCDGLTKFRD
ncbi:MAG: aspartate carbamoyltransferase regulatory subunit [Tissierellia bacterium]|nr:aspartate carbamoyltransferase regulatory subunit [Tissierellia bacterium]